MPKGGQNIGRPSCLRRLPPIPRQRHAHLALSPFLAFVVAQDDHRNPAEAGVGLDIGQQFAPVFYGCGRVKKKVEPWPGTDSPPAIGLAIAGDETG